MSEHISVLLKESINLLEIKEDGIYVDCTLGGGGHASEILKKIPNGHLYAFDQDAYAREKAKEKLDAVGSNYTIIPKNFVHIKESLLELGIKEVDGILYDLGVSSFQFDLPDRGFSYNYDAPLDMRMDQSQTLNAKDIINTAPLHELITILYKYADESFAKPIARAITKRRAIKPIETTFELVDIIKSALPEKVKRKKGHPAKKTFQALRIAVNNELDVLEDSLTQSLSILKSQGCLVVISFQSLEDKITKRLFKEVSEIHIPKNVPMQHLPTPEFTLLHKKVILPTDEEQSENRRSHSAKLRAIRKN